MNASSLRLHEVRALLDAVDHLHQPVEPADFPAHLFGILARLLPGTVASFDSVERSTGQVESHISPDGLTTAPLAQVEAAVREFLHQHPAVPHLASHATAVVQPLDLVSQREFHRTDFYQHCFRPLDIEHQIAAGLVRPGYVSGFVVNRAGARPFSAREVELVRSLRPHVERAYGNALLLREMRQRLAAHPPPGRETVAASAPLRVGLTAREMEVLHWVGAGKRNAEIAGILGVSHRTVEKHVENLFAKLGVETRTAALALSRTH